ncbi:MAG TPA: lysophospholipid acyltransferase family protein, partial [Xanthomonadaceae bacterium]|nr:lysophospholipid acyltransferase family protein [Xanthomonadaceae bacterium]
MPLLEDRLRQRFPRLFQGRSRHLARPLLHGMARWSRFDAIEAFLQDCGQLQGFAFVDASLEFVRLRYEVDEAQLASIPARGRLLVVANHPSGALDALALLHAIGRVRRDVRIVANEVLALLAPLGPLMLPVRVFGGHAQTGSVRAIEHALRQEQCVIVFPAGEVSRLGPQGVRDGQWKRGFAGLARRTGAPVLPVRIRARNSALFYGASALYKPAATALLAREMFARRERPLRLHIGRASLIHKDEDPAQAARRIRQVVYALGRGKATLARGPEPIAPPVDEAVLREAIAATDLLGRTADGKQIRLAQLADGAPLLLEIGRLRELTFRRVGEGTGRARDLDEYDPHYQHIVVWDEAAGRIAGAYRIVRGATALARAGLRGLYTASLFRYADDAIPRLAQGLELGRSFVHPDYWGSRSLDYLWQGIGAYLQRHPGVRYLFGAVSISAALPLTAREQIVAYYQRYYGCDDPLASSLRPFAYFAAPPCFGGLDAETAFDVLKANLA